jgi:hypothetical protein
MSERRGYTERNRGEARTWTLWCKQEYGEWRGLGGAMNRLFAPHKQIERRKCHIKV